MSETVGFTSQVEQSVQGDGHAAHTLVLMICRSLCLN